MAAPQYTVPWALERIVAELGQSEANLTQPTSDLYANRLLRVLNSEYMLLSSEGMAKGHPLLMRYVNVTADENGKIEDFRWYADRGDLIGLCPRRNAEDLE